jgi:NitT/TauT family transport system substrate-binding protein
MLRRHAIFILLAGLIFTFSITGLFMAPIILEDGDNIKIGYSPLPFLLPFFVAVENGYFQEQGINVTLIEFANNDQIMDALIAGRLDTAALSLPVILGVEQNGPGSFKMYMAAASTAEGNNNEHIIVLKNASISSLYDLKGKTMGLYPSSAHKVWAKVLLKNFMNPNEDITFVHIPPTLHLQALESGRVDAVMTTEPMATIGLKSGKMKEIDNSVRAKYVCDPFYNVGWLFSTHFIENNPEKADKIKMALEKAVDYIRENEESARKPLTKYTPQPEDLIYDVTIPVYHKVGEIDREAIQKFADILHDGGTLTGWVDTSDIYY